MRKCKESILTIIKGKGKELSLNLLERKLWKKFQILFALRREVFYFLQAVYNRTTAGLFVIEILGVRASLFFYYAEIL